MTQEFIKQTLTKEQLGVPDDGLIHLYDLTFDFKDYFERYKQLSEEEQDEFQCRIMGLFCKEFFESGGDPSAISPWVASYIANALFQVLEGAPFNQVLPTPFEPRQSLYTRKGERAMSIYCAIENERRHGEKTISTLMQEQSQIHNLSYEAIRADYYKVKGCLQKGKSLPDDFFPKSTT